MRLFTKLGIVAAITAMLIPAITYANFGSENTNTATRFHVADDVKTDMRHDSDAHHGLHMGLFGKMFARGTVTSVGSGSFMITTKNNTSVTVEASEAKLIRIPNTSISLSDIKVGDRVWVHGVRSENKIEATTIYDISAEVKPAVAKGEVTAIDGDNITLETKHHGTITVTADDDTVIKQDGETAAAGDIEVGSRVKVFGWLNKLTDFFSAVLIKLK